MAMLKRLFFILSLLLLISLKAEAATLQMEKLPSGERWFGIYYDDKRVGFSYVRISENGAGYEIRGESSVKMGGFVFSREASIRETYSINRDLTLRSFSASQTIDGKFSTVAGETTSNGLKVAITSSGKKREKILKSNRSLYSPMVLNFIPLHTGAETGKVYRVNMIDVEAAKIKGVKITVVGPDAIGKLKTLHLKNDLFPVDNDIWVDYEGNTVKESVRDGLVVTLAEKDEIIRAFVSEAALTRQDFIEDFSKIRTERAISRPADVKMAVIELSSFPGSATVLENAVQKGKRLEGNKIVFTIDNIQLPGDHRATKDESPDAAFLKPSETVPSDHAAIAAKKSEVVASEKDKAHTVEKLSKWVSSNIKAENGGTSAPLDALAKSKGNGLAHARLFSSLARAAGIPTRMVYGIVYLQDHGFLYHSWAECHIGSWIPVDPTSGEYPANPLHIKLAEGDSPGDMAALADFVGKISANVVEVK